MMGQGETDPARPLLAEGRSPRRGRPTGAKVPRAAAAGTGREGVRQLRPPVARDSAPSRLPRLRSSLLHRRVLPEILALLQGTGRLPPAVSPTACERRQRCWPRRRCPPQPPALCEGPPRPEQVAPGLGRGGTIPASRSQESGTPSGGEEGGHTTRHPPTVGAAGTPGPPRSEDAAGAPSAGATPGRDGNRPRRRGPRRKHPPGLGGRGRGRDTAPSEGHATLGAPRHGTSQGPSFSRARGKDFLQASLILNTDIPTA